MEANSSVSVSQLSSPSTQEAWLTNGTPGEMSSPASTSSLFNRLQLDDDLEDGGDPFAFTDTRDLFVTVDDPKKHVCTMETYITYRVSTKVCSWLLHPSVVRDLSHPLDFVMSMCRSAKG